MATVEDYGAVGDGVTDDRTAFSAMAAATGGLIAVMEKEYFVNGLFLNMGRVQIVGARKPVMNAAKNALTSGSVLVGSVTINALDIEVSDFGVDRGVTRSDVTGDGLIVNAPPGMTGRSARINRISSMGDGDGLASSSPTHAILCEGFERIEAEDNDVARHYYGLVAKSRNGRIRNTTGYLITDVTVYPKSDTPDVAGNVADGSASCLLVEGTKSQAAAGNDQHDAVRPHGSTLGISNIVVKDTSTKLGRSAVRVFGGSEANSAVNVHIDGWEALSSWDGCILEGYTKDCSIRNGSAVNVARSPVKISGNSKNFLIDGVQDTVTSDAPRIDVLDIASGATGAWDNIGARGKAMRILYPIGPVVGGKRSGTAKIYGEGTPVCSNGATPGDVPFCISILPGNYCQFKGKVNVAGHAGGPIVSMAADFNFGDQKFFPVVGIVSVGGATSYTTVLGWVQGHDVLILTKPAGLVAVDFSGVGFLL